MNLEISAHVGLGERRKERESMISFSFQVWRFLAE